MNIYHIGQGKEGDSNYIPQGWIGGIENKPAEGERYLEAHCGKLVNGVLTGYGSHTATFSTPNPAVVKEAVERSWRNSELSRTDSLVMLPDYPVDLLAYRVLLRNYPTSADFPNGTRPAL